MNHFQRMMFFTSIRTILLSTLMSACLTCTMQADDQQLEAQQEQAIQNAVNNVANSVVRIETLGGAERVGKVVVGTGPTTGLIVDRDGYVISSSFNFIQDPTSILITLPGGKRANAKIVSRDESRKLVLLKVDTEQELPLPTMAPKNEMEVGQWAIAIGRTLSNKTPNVSVGIVSALNRIWGKAIQTDAKISPMNYGGPLIDIKGRVIGVLVPMSPQGNEEVAGTEWYDSGIGFVIPLEDILAKLEKLKTGTTIKPGLLGVSLKGDNIFVDKPVVLNCSPTSPAAQAGLKANDQIVAINGQTVTRQSELKHLIGPLDAGEIVAVSVVREEQRLEFEFELAAEIRPYDQPFLGILPQRNRDNVQVKHVFDESAAARAGLKKDDRIVRIGKAKVTDVDSLVEQLQSRQAGDKTEIEFQRKDEKFTEEIEFGTFSLAIPKLDVGDEKAGENEVETVVTDLKVVGEENQCLLLTPGNLDRVSPASCIVFLAAPGKLNRESIKRRWSEVCAREGMLVIVPESLDPQTWTPTETEFVRKAIEKVMTDYPVDPRRVAIWGEEAGGTFALLSTFAHRDLIRCVVCIDGSIPARLRPPDTMPQYPLSVYLSQSKAEEDGKPSMLQKLAEVLGKRKFPTIFKSGSKPGELKEEILGWIQTLDRI